MKLFVSLALFSSFCALAVETPQASQIIVRISNLKSNNGQVMVSLFSEANREFFPGKVDHATDAKKAPIKDKKAEVILEGKDGKLPPGVYAVGFYHDENGNEKMDTNFIGIPTESGGASNNPKPRMGPPLFEASQFEFKSGAHLIEIVVQ